MRSSGQTAPSERAARSAGGARNSMSECLKVKRQIERNGWKDRKDTRYSCEKRQVEVAVGIDGKEYIVKLVD